MPDNYTYPYFPYQQLLYYRPPAPAHRLFYPDLIQRLINHIDVKDNPLPTLQPCWLWRKAPMLMAHKYLGNVPIRHLGLALYLPDEYNALKRTAKNQIRLTKFHHRCNNSNCVRPDHHIPHKTHTFRIWATRPPVASQRAKRDDWLRYYEMEYLRACMLVSIRSPDDLIAEFAERINLPFGTVGNVWDTLRKQLETQFELYSVLKE